MKMDKRIKKMWVEALESGEYRQGRGALKKNGGFCCLGVLCDLYHKETGKGKWYRLEDKKKTSFFSVAKTKLSKDEWQFSAGSEVEGELPLEVQDWAKLDSTNPKAGSERLMKLNDGDYDYNGRTLPHSWFDFKSIAHRIRKYL